MLVVVTVAVPVAVLVAVCPAVFRAPERPALLGGCLVHPWAAARPLAVRAASLDARRVGSEPGQAPPPPTGTAAWISSRSAPSKQQGIGVPGDFQIQLDPAAAFVQFACGGGID